LVFQPDYVVSQAEVHSQVVFILKIRLIGGDLVVISTGHEVSMKAIEIQRFVLVSFCDARKGIWGVPHNNARICGLPAWNAREAKRITQPKVEQWALFGGFGCLL
jgi:hypothetical protein